MFDPSTPTPTKPSGSTSTPGPDPSAVAWGKVQGYLEKLFNALDDLDEAGGVKAAAKSGGWSLKAHTKALGSLEAVRGQIEVALSRAGAGLTRASGKGKPGRTG